MGKCFFTGEDAHTQVASNYDACIYRGEYGHYWVVGYAIEAFTGSHKLTPYQVMNCIYETLRLNGEGLTPYWVAALEDDTPKNLSDHPNVVTRSLEAVGNMPIQHKNKEEKLLAEIAEKASLHHDPFTLVQFTKPDLFRQKISGVEEFLRWLLSLRSKALVEFSDYVEQLLPQIAGEDFFEDICLNLMGSPSIRLTPSGWDLVHNLKLGSNSKDVFIAMAFTDGNRNPLPPELRNDLKSILDNLGWNPVIVDEVEYNEGIMDKVIASINDSPFIIAELTHQKSGVYYEAGYAKGRGIPVIHIVNGTDLLQCHFDVRHLNLVVWTTTENLTSRLTNRIKATIRSRHGTQ